MAQPRAGVAYSYLRFSTKKQERGDSIRRQNEARDRWLARNPGVAMATDGAYEELGASSFRGKHRLDDKTALYQFIRAVESGRVKTGSYLIVESFDRLTREEFGEAAEFVLGLVNRGIKIVQLSPVEVVLEKPVDLTKALVLVVELTRGHGESQRKSEVISAVWEGKRKESRITKQAFTARPPSWLVRDDGKFAFRPRAKELVRRIFRLASGGYGCRAIAATLNKEQVPTWEPTTKHWHESLIRRIVAGREALGELQPRVRGEDGRRVAEGDPIVGYYPPAVTEAEWRAAEVARVSRTRRGGRPAKHAGNVHLFTGLLRDGLTGDNLTPLRRHQLIVVVPTGFRTRGERGSSFPLAALERAILSQLAELDPREVLDTDATSNGPDEVAELTAKLVRLETTLRTLADQFDGAGEDIPAIAAKVRATNAERKLTVELIDAAKARAASPLSAAWGDCHGLTEAIDAAEGEKRRDLRLRLKGVLARILESVTCVFAGDTRVRLAAVRVQFHASAAHRDYLIVHRARDTRANRPESTLTVSFASAGIADCLDMRDQTDASTLAKFLAAADVEKLAAAIGNPKT